jgi:hypothetical protein
VAEAPRPPPVVTIVDPRHPAALQDPEVAEPTRLRLPLRRDERLLLVLVLLLLLVGVTQAVALRADQRLRARLDSLRATAVPTGGGPVLGSRSFMVLEVVIAGARDEALPLRGFRVDGGWRVTAAEPRAFGIGQRLFLQHSLDCRSPVVPPRRLSSAHRTLVVPVRGPVDERVTDLAEVCGRIGPAAALLVVGSSGPDPVALELVNRGLDDLAVEALRVEGFALRPDRPLPLPLPGRAPGVLRFLSLPRTRLVLAAVVTDCPRARQRLLRSAPVAAVVRGPRQRVLVDLPVPEVEGLLWRAWSAGCPTS